LSAEHPTVVAIEIHARIGGAIRFTKRRPGIWSWIGTVLIDISLPALARQLASP